MSDQNASIDAILIAGPTASGKSALALELACRLGGVVVNADASQVYRDLRVLTARPSAAEERAAPHALYGHVDATEAYGVGRWLADVTALIQSAPTETYRAYPQAPDRLPGETAPRPVPVFVGGTGLYFEALLEGLAAIPDIPSELREKWRAFGPPAALHAELARRDPAMAARLRPTDPQRLMRALEVIDATGRSLGDWQTDPKAGLLSPDRCLRLVLSPDRGVLDARIARRLEAMIAGGAAEEAAALDARGLDPSLPATKALGARPLAAFARGALSRDEAFERIRLDTRRYAKRQMTWFRNRMTDWIHVAPEKALRVAETELGRGDVSGAPACSRRG